MCEVYIYTKGSLCVDVSSQLFACAVVKLVIETVVCY